MLNLRYSVLATNRLDVFSSTKQRESQSWACLLLALSGENWLDYLFFILWNLFL